jgi:myo-inositol-1(or 4)-monophosphatase
LARTVALDAAAFLEAGLDDERQVSTKSTPTDMVTEMDRGSEDRIVSAILAERPDDAIVGEEGTDRPGTSGVRWIIDPLDGTTNYLYRHPGFNVSVAAELDGEVVAGAVVDPLHHDVFDAVRGHGARRNGRPIAPSTETDRSRALVATGFGYDRDRRRHQARVLTHVLPHVRDLRRMGAAAVDLCSVACGRLDAYYEYGLALWDHAAGALIATEAGAVVTHLDGGPVRDGFLVVAPPSLHPTLLDLLQAAHELVD